MRKRNVLMSVVVTTVALGAAPAMGAGGSERPRPQATPSCRDVQVALQRDLGLSAEQAKRHGALQGKAIKLDKQLRESLGAAFAGSSYDARTGKLVVSVSDASKLDDARTAGADARLVTQPVRAPGDRRRARQGGGQGRGASATVRRPNGPRQASVAGITGWFVDETTNTVRVTVKKSHAQQAAASLAKYGDAVTIEQSDIEPAPATFMDGGDLINNSSCSAGFNLRNTYTGKGFLLTAGHCVSGGSTLYGQGPGGTTRSAGARELVPRRRRRSRAQRQRRQLDPGPVGGLQPVQRQHHHHELVHRRPGRYDGLQGRHHDQVDVRVDQRQEPDRHVHRRQDDLRPDAAHGMRRAGRLGRSQRLLDGFLPCRGRHQRRLDGHDSTGRLRCLQTIGQTNVSWYYPIAKSLAYYGPKYGVGTW